jgi:hypothetical protein
VTVDSEFGASSGLGVGDESAEPVSRVVLRDVVDGDQRRLDVGAESSLNSSTSMGLRSLSSDKSRRRPRPRASVATWLPRRRRRPLREREIPEPEALTPWR